MRSTAPLQYQMPTSLMITWTLIVSLMLFNYLQLQLFPEVELTFLAYLYLDLDRAVLDWNLEPIALVASLEQRHMYAE